MLDHTDHRGIRWGYVFLRSGSYLGPDDFKDIMVQAVEMFLQGEEERNVKSSGFEGKLFTEMRYEIIGGLGGQRFDADLETPYGRDKASFLVSEQTRGYGSAISRN